MVHALCQIVSTSEVFLRCGGGLFLPMQRMQGTPSPIVEEALDFVHRKNIVTEQVLRAPLSHLPNNWQHAVAHRSQCVLYFWRNDLVFGTFDKPKGSQSFQFATQHAGSNFLGAASTA